MVELSEFNMSLSLVCVSLLDIMVKQKRLGLYCQTKVNRGNVVAPSVEINPQTQIDKQEGASFIGSHFNALHMLKDNELDRNNYSNIKKSANYKWKDVSI